MKKRLAGIMMAGVLAVSLLAGCGGGSSGSGGSTPAAEPAATEAKEDSSAAVPTGEIKVWVADNVVDFTKSQIKTFQEENPEYAGFTVTVEPVGEGNAAQNMITDVAAGRIKDCRTGTGRRDSHCASVRGGGGLSGEASGFPGRKGLRGQRGVNGNST